MYNNKLHWYILILIWNINNQKTEIHDGEKVDKTTTNHCKEGNCILLYRVSTKCIVSNKETCKAEESLILY